MAATNTAKRVGKKKTKFIEIFKKNFGLIAQTCEAVGIDRGTYYNWRNSDPDFDKACEEIKEYVGDFVENKILKKMQQGDTTMLIFYAKTKLKNRGYTERTEVTGADGKDLVPPRTLTKEEIKQAMSDLDGEY